EATHTSFPNFGKVEYFWPCALTHRSRVLPVAQRKGLWGNGPANIALPSAQSRTRRTMTPKLTQVIATQQSKTRAPSESGPPHRRSEERRVGKRVTHGRSRAACIARDLLRRFDLREKGSREDRVPDDTRGPLCEV